MQEFIQIWALGGNATLNLTTTGGHAEVEFKCTLGQPGAPHSLSPSASFFPPNPPRPRHRGPADIARNRRRAACHQAILAKNCPPQQPASVPATDSAAAEPSTASVAATTASTTATSEHEEPDSGSSPVFKCDQCSYTNSTERGLGQHVRMRHRISQVDGNIDSDEEQLDEPDHVTLELDDMGGIIGPKLSPNSTPPNKVYHPNAGLGLLEDEPSVTSDGDTFLCYYFPDDPKTFIVSQGPNRGLRMRSIYDVFLVS